LAIVIWLWPDGITDVAFSALTIGLVLKAAGAVLAAITGLAVVASIWAD